MFFYILLFFLVFLFSFCYTYAKNSSAAVCFKIITFLLLFLPSALRYGIGTDYKNYVRIFNEIKDGVDVSRIEIGWYLLNKGCIELGVNVQWIFIISSFFTVYYMIKTPKKDFFVVIILFFCLFYLDSYNITRQCLTMAICWYAYLCFINEKKKKCYFYVTISSLFHTSGLIILFCFFLIDKLKVLRKKTVNIIIIGCFFLSYTNILMTILCSLLSFTKYAVYFETFEYFNELSGGFGNSVTLLFRTIILLYIFNFFVYTKNDKENKIIIYFLIILELFDVIALDFFMANRAKMLFYLSYLMIMMPIYKKNGDVIVKMKKFIIISFFILYYLVLKLITGANAIVPYQMISF